MNGKKSECRKRAREIYKPTLNWKIVSKSLNNGEFSSKKGHGDAYGGTRSEGGRATSKAQRAGIFDFLQMSNDHYRNKFQKETTETMLVRLGERNSIHVVVDASPLCSPASTRDNTSSSDNIIFTCIFDSKSFFLLCSSFFIYAMALKWFYRKIFNQLSTWWDFLRDIVYLSE